MKKLTSIVLAAVLAATLTATLTGCGESKSSDSSKTSTASTASTASTTESSKAADSSADESKESAASAAETESGLAVVLTKVKEQVEFPAETQDVTAKRIDRTYGISESQMDDFTGLYCADGVNQEQFIVIKAKTEDDIPVIQEKFQNNIDSLYNVIKNYTPDQAAIIEAAQVKTEGMYVYYIISASADTIESIIKEAI